MNAQMNIRFVFIQVEFQFSGMAVILAPHTSSNQQLTQDPSSGN